MTSRSGHLSPAAGPLEDDNLLREILLRLPPQPSSLPRASAVCKRWRCLASDPRFCRRFRRHHRQNPPLLGFFNRDSDLFPFVPTLEPPNRVSPGRFSLQRREGDRFISLGCRHGLVLIHNVRPNKVLVWDPVTGKQHHLAIPPELVIHAENTAINGAVLRAAGDIQQFHVVLTVVDNVDKQKQHKRALAWLYSSETNLWGDLVSTPVPFKVSTSDILGDEDDVTLVFTGKPAVMVRDSLYWILAGNFVGILEFDLEKQSLAVIRVPAHMLENGFYQFWIMRAEGGGPGLLLQKDQSFQLWKRKTDRDGVASWVLGRTIDLDKLLSLNGNGSQVILGFAEENNVVFVWTHGVLFMVNLESLQFKKLGETRTLSHYHPFESVYTAETEIGGGHDGVDLSQHIR